MARMARRSVRAALAAAVMLAAGVTVAVPAGRVAALPVDFTPVYSNLTGTITIDVDLLDGKADSSHHVEHAVYHVDLADLTDDPTPRWHQLGVTIDNEVTYHEVLRTGDLQGVLCDLSDHDVRSASYSATRLFVDADASMYGAGKAYLQIGTAAPGYHVDSASGTDCTDVVSWYESRAIANGEVTCRGSNGNGADNVANYTETATTVSLRFDCTKVEDDPSAGRHHVVHIVAALDGTKRSGQLQPLSPARVLDTRAGGTTVDGRDQGIGERAAGSTTTLVLAGRAEVPADASAAIVNVAVTEPRAGGFLTLYPCGTTRPLAASINFAAGQTISNAVTARLGSGGATCIYTYAATHVVVDVTGAYPADAGFQALVPARLVDTRAGEHTVDGRYEGIGALRAGTTTSVVMTGRGGVPTNATSVVLNVAVTGAAADGYLTLFPCDFSRPLAASISYRAGDTISNAVTARIGFFEGDVCVYTYATADVVIDVTGALAGGVGFHPMPPARILDSRPGYATADNISMMLGIRSAGSTTQVGVATRPSVAPSTARVAVLNVTVTGALAAGFVTVYPCGEPRPLAASLNYDAGQTISNSVTAKLGVGGAICVYTHATTHIVIDITATQS